MPQVQVIEPVNSIYRYAPPKLRVCSYARVSSDSADQLNSFSVQMEHYTSLIAGNDEWELVDIYADEGITGTRSDTRTENQINRELEKSEVDSDYIKLLIFGCAAAKYEASADTEPEYLTRRLLSIFEKQPPLDSFSIQLFEDTVKQVIVDADGSLWLRMINGKLIQNQAGKE